MAVTDGPRGFDRLPSVDQVLRAECLQPQLDRFGRKQVVTAVRSSLETARAALRAGADERAGIDDIATAVVDRLERDALARSRPVFNLTGTILHSNLGRALLAEAAVEAAISAMRSAMTLEFDLIAGRRGDRDLLVRDLLTELTGAEDATVVNNNAAAVLLTLTTLAKGRETIVSRGELIEIGGSFRMPDIMAQAETRLVEVGTTNRTHLHDYEGAVREETGLLLKVHTSNYRIEGFTSEVAARELAGLAQRAGIPLVNDLGSGSLVDLSRYGLTREPTVAEAVGEGADLVTFSGDKLLGGPQAGFIVGRKDLIKRIRRHPMKRAMRLDKIRLAALEATLRLYRHPEKLGDALPTLRLLARPLAEIEGLAERLKPAVAAAVGPNFAVEVTRCSSQIGSGALPQEKIESAGLAIRHESGRVPSALAAALRALPRPVIGRVADQAVILDLRCLEEEDSFRRNLAGLEVTEAR